MQLDALERLIESGSLLRPAWHTDTASSRDWLPLGIRSPGHASSRQAISTFESQHCVIDHGHEILVRQLFKLYERFSPGSEGLKGDDYARGFGKYLQLWGITQAQDLHTISRDLGTYLCEQGAACYFPLGTNSQGVRVFEKHWYFAPDLQYEMLTASEWKLLSMDAKLRLANSRMSAIGLSVGSESVFQALTAGMTRFDLCDPGTLHMDAQGRLSDFGYNQCMLGVNKTVVLANAIMKRYPYAELDLYPDGITDANAGAIISESKFSAGARQRRGFWIISEEADQFHAKVLTRQYARKLPPSVEWHHLMLADIGATVAFFHETHADDPFFGYLRDVDENSDPYGASLKNSGNELLGIFAAAGGVTHVGEPLLTMIEQGTIGQFAHSQITRIPQSREATQLAGSFIASSIRLFADGSPVKPVIAFNLREHLKMPDVATRVHALNRKLFGRPWLL